MYNQRRICPQQRPHSSPCPCCPLQVPASSPHINDLCLWLMTALGVSHTVHEPRRRYQFVYAWVMQVIHIHEMADLHTLHKWPWQQPMRPSPFHFQYLEIYHVLTDCFPRIHISRPLFRHLSRLLLSTLWRYLHHWVIFSTHLITAQIYAPNSDLI